MSTRTTETTVTFRRSFTLLSLDGAQPAGTYRLVTEEEQIPGLSFTAFRRTATLLHLPADPVPAAFASLQVGFKGPNYQGVYRSNLRHAQALSPGQSSRKNTQPSKARQSRSSMAAVMRSRWLHHTQGGMPTVICSIGIRSCISTERR